MNSLGTPVVEMVTSEVGKTGFASVSRHTSFSLAVAARGVASSY